MALSSGPGEGAVNRGIGFSPFGMDFTGYSNYPLAAHEADAKALAAFALEYEIIGPMAAELADVSFRGDLFGAAEGSAVPSRPSRSGVGRRSSPAAFAAFGNANAARKSVPIRCGEATTPTLGRRAGQLPGMRRPRTVRSRWIAPQSRPSADLSVPPGASPGYSGTPVQFHCQPCSRGRRRK